IGCQSDCQPEICDNRVDDDQDCATYCADPDCAVEGDGTCFDWMPEVGDACSDGLDNDFDGLTDCLEPFCGSWAAACNNLDGKEDCTNGADDDGDNQYDCQDAYCYGNPDCADQDCWEDPDCQCQVEICEGRFDEDCDGLTDEECGTAGGCEVERRD